ncbi:hypothetical protein EPO66_03005 [bacterium]|nr:MAG: hypothetical protein EPO66_03005 [bacterium]
MIISNKFKKNVLILCALAGLFLILRLAVLLSYSNRLYELEELYRGTIGKEIIHGPLMPLWEYLDFKVEYFPGGTIVVGILAVPFFLLFGPTYVSLKLVGLSFALGTFVLWYLFLDKFFSRRVAVITALLFIFCVPFYTMTSLITWGAHPEANFFTILSIYIFYGIFFVNQERNKLKFLALGLISGFGLWFVQTYLVTIIFILACWYIFDKSFLRKKVFFIFSGGFFIGFLPAIYYAFSYGRNIWGINGKTLFTDAIACDLNNIMPKAITFFRQDLPNSFLFCDFLKIRGQAFSYIYYFIFALALIYLLYRYGRDILRLCASLIYPITLKEVKVDPDLISREAIILAYPLFFFLCYIFSSYSILPQPWEDPRIWPHYIGYRYMIPVMPFILATSGIFIGKLRSKKIAYFILFLVIGLGLIGNLNLISLKNFGGFSTDRGYSYAIVGDKIGLRAVDGLKEYIAPFEKLDSGLRNEFYEGLGSGIAWRMQDENIDKVTSFFESEIKKEYYPYLYRGWGTLFYPDYPEEFRKSLLVAACINPEYKPFFYEGFGRNMYFFDDISRSIDFINKIEEKYREYCYKGLGYSIGFEFRNDLAQQAKLLGKIDDKYKVFVHEGMFEGMRHR